MLATCVALTCIVAIAGVSPAQPGAAAPGEAAKPQPAQPADTKTMAAADKLKACAAMYAGLKTYKDEGNVSTEMQVPGMSAIKSDAPFSTAFERAGRFQWEFRHSVVPGRKPDQQYVVASKDQKSFATSWTVDKRPQTHNSIGLAMAGPTGISGGSATAIVPLLCPDVQIAFRTTDIQNPVDKGREQVDGVECSVISGTHSFPGGDDPQVTVWIDDKLAIRKVYQSQKIDPKKLGNLPGVAAGPAFMANTTITIKPQLEPAMADKDFVPPAIKQAR